MGANFQEYELPGSHSVQQVQEWFRQEQERCRDEHGSDPYNGTFSTVKGISFPSIAVFEDVRKAQDWLTENTEKCSAKAVKAKKVSSKPKKRPTFGGKEQGYVGEWKSFIWVHHSTAPIFTPADQLTEPQKQRLEKLAKKYQEARAASGAAHEVFHPLELTLRNMEAEFTDYKGLKTARGKYAKAYLACKKAHELLKALDEQFAAKLYKDEQVDECTVWVIGGWCAE